MDSTLEKAIRMERIGTLTTGTALLVAGGIHLIPAVGVLGPAVLSTLYDVPLADPNLRVLLRHRAMLFGLLGAPLIAASVVPSWQPPAIAAGLISTTSYLALHLAERGPLNLKLNRVFRVDCIAAGLLLVAGFIRLSSAQNI